MLFNLEPDITVTGGAWYSDQDFESEFVEVLNQQCYKYLEQKVRNRNCDGQLMSVKSVHLLYFSKSLMYPDGRCSGTIMVIAFVRDKGEQFPSFHAVSILYFNMMCNSVKFYPTDAGQHKILEKGGSRYTLAKAMPHMGFGVSPHPKKFYNGGPLKWDF